jgi:hypothetical protein
MTESFRMNKPGKSQPRALSDLLHKTLTEAFAKRGFASSEIVTRWSDIAGPEIAQHSQPEKIQWSRPTGGEAHEPATLVLRVEGPAAVEIQHLSAVVLERVNRFFGWQVVGQLRLHQAPLRRGRSSPFASANPKAAEEIAAQLGEIRSPDLRNALARLGAAIKQP